MTFYHKCVFIKPLQYTTYRTTLSPSRFPFCYPFTAIPVPLPLNALFIKPWQTLVSSPSL